MNKWKGYDAKTMCLLKKEVTDFTKYRSCIYFITVNYIDIFKLLLVSEYWKSALGLDFGVLIKKKKKKATARIYINLTVVFLSLCISISNYCCAS